MKNLFLFSLNLILFLMLCPGFATAQTEKLSANDTAQILKAIILDWDFNQSETWSDGEKQPLYLIVENLPVEQIPQVKGIKFKLISEEKAKEFNDKELEYYLFEIVEVKKSFVRVFFSRNYHSAKEANRRREANGANVEYNCKKVAGKWRVKGHLLSVFAT